MSCLHVQNCQIICQIMMQITFHYCFIFFSLHFCFQRVMFQKLAQNYIYFIFPVVQYSYDCACVALQLLNNTCGDVEVKPGPKNCVSECLSICHWNLNSILVHDYSKLFLLKVYIYIYIYILVHKFDIICLSET